MSDYDKWVKPFVVASAAALAAIIVVIVGLGWYGTWLDKREARQWQISDGVCNIAVVPLQGDVVAYDGDTFYPDATNLPVATSGDWAERYIRHAGYDPAIQGVLLQVDSYGGYAAPGFQVKNALEKSPVPTVAYIREVGTSAAYLAALGADTIIASPFASVGSIGVTYSYVQNVKQNEKEGLEFVQLSSGEYKDAGNPNKPLTAAERALYERDADIFENVFVSLVASSRGFLQEDAQRLADGSSMAASLALEEGLVDQVGDEETVRAWFAEELGLSPEEVIFCN